jgi:superfamily I DNA/RNA helicase
VLYRTNSQSRLFEEAMRRYGLKYKVVGGFSFYERAEIKDMISYLKVIQNPDDSISLLRVINTPTRGIGKSTIDIIESLALETGLVVVGRDWRGDPAAVVARTGAGFAEKFSAVDCGCAGDFGGEFCGAA